jgi:kinesin family protein 11
MAGTPQTPRVGSFTLSTVSSTPTPASEPADKDSHPVEVVGRIREHPDGNGQPSAIQALPNGRDLRITSKEHQQGYRVFSLDGVSKAEDESLEAFYSKYAEARVEDVKLGGKCTIMMYGPTGAGKSYTMFGSGGDKGVAYHALTQIMGDGLLNESGRGQEVKATVWEIFNEDIYDLLAQTNNPAGSMKGHTNRVRAELTGGNLFSWSSIVVIIL